MCHIDSYTKINKGASKPISIYIYIDFHQQIICQRNIRDCILTKWNHGEMQMFTQLAK